MSTKIRKFLILSILSIFVLPLLAACGSNAVDVSLGTPEQTYTMQLSKDSAKAGEVTFHLTNNAASETHEFVIVQTDLPADSLPMNEDGSLVLEDQINAVDEAEDIEPGDSVDLTVNLPAGHYALICNIENHYTQGMHTDFTVNP
ncbi:MAG TPA: sulfocyanin-like copper-binding protein [Anaerolineales bacterium]|jgi:uncharacterized cupredoxin-like copper-binding protein|nr:sulfocyanin-like copper-binding protein [Anaerolineales bacterium]